MLRFRVLLSIIAVARMVMSFVIRQPAWIVQSIIFVLSTAVILWSWGGSRGIAYFITGGIVGTAFGYGVNIVGQEIGWAKISRTLDLFIASPTSPRIYAAGVFLGGLPFIVPELVVYLLVSSALGYTQLALVSMAVSLLVILLASLMGVAIALSIKRPGNISAITNPITTILTLFPPVFYPVKILPESLRPLTLAIPTVAGAELARGLGGLEISADPLILASILVAWTIAMLMIINRVGVKTL